MSRGIYMLKLTDDGEDRAPSYEINSAMVVVARDTVHARIYASHRAMDEGPDTWLDGRWSSIEHLGNARFTVPTGVLVSEDNAS